MPSRIAARSTTHGHAGEVLQQDARRHEGDFLLGVLGRIPAGEGADVVGLDEGVVLAPQQVLEQDLQRVRQLGDLREAGPLERGQADVFDRASGRLERGPRTERIEPGHRNPKCYHRARASAAGMTAYNRADSLRR